MIKYTMTPIQAAEAKRLFQRIRPTVKVRWKIDIPNNPSKLYKLWVLNKAHIERTIPYLMVMHSDELYNIGVEIENGNVAPVFRAIIDNINENRGLILMTKEIIISEYEIFDYESHKNFNVREKKKQQDFNVKIPEAFKQQLKM